MTAAELHAAVNDAAPALLAASALFDAAGLALRRESLRQAGFWTLVAGLAGVALAIGTGLLAADRIAHGPAIHEAMKGHRLLGFAAAGWWAVLGTWRLWRPATARALYVTVALLGAGLVLVAAHRGGQLVFRLGAGLPVAVHENALADMAGEHEHAPGTEHDHTVPSTDNGGSGDSADTEAAHTDPPGTPAHQH